ncbi:MAG: PfkB family carbohydrate kinase [Propionibacteriaceae bacterium]|nr:PfkB family carbohydrate kinase [Propionibacteriaceae bacterium]
MPRVIVLGSINTDQETLVPTFPKPGEKVVGTSLSRHAGGKGANQAVAARAQGAEVIMVGAVGDDPAGRSALNMLFAHGIKLQVERIAQVPTGQAIIWSDGQANAIVVVPGANAKVGPNPLRPIHGMGPEDLLLTQLETPVDVVAGAVRYARKYGARVMVNAAPYADLPADVIEAADPLVIPAADLPAFEASGVRPASLVVLHGKAGLDWDGERFAGPVVADDEVVDTVGATDALIGALAAAIAGGAERATAARTALGAAADNVRHAGSQPDPRLRPALSE